MEGVVAGTSSKLDCANFTMSIQIILLGFMPQEFQVSKLTPSEILLYFVRMADLALP